MLNHDCSWVVFRWSLFSSDDVRRVDSSEVVVMGRFWVVFVGAVDRQRREDAFDRRLYECGAVSCRQDFD